MQTKHHVNKEKAQVPKKMGIIRIRALFSGLHRTKAASSKIHHNPRYVCMSVNLSGWLAVCMYVCMSVCMYVSKLG